MAKLDLDSSELEASRTAISNAITTFARADRVGDDVAGLTGHGGLAGKVQDFAGNWDHKRSQLQKGLESIRDMLQAIAETFEDLDRGMADQIRSAGFGGFGGPHGPGPLGKGGPILPPHTQGTIQDDGGMRPVGPAGSIGPIGPGGEIGPVTTVEPNIPGHPNAPGHPAAPVDSAGPVPPAAPEGPATNPPMNVGSLPDSRLPEDPEVCPPKVIDDEPRIATLPDRRLIEDVEMCDGYPTRDPDRVFETLPAIADFGPIHLDPTPNLQAYESESEGTR